MKDLYDLFKEISPLFGTPITGWTVALFILLYFLRNRITTAIDNLLDWLGRNFASEAGSRRFEPKYKEFVRAAHLHLKIVGIRTEEERRPKITDAYVPVKLLQKGDSIEQGVSVDQVVRDNDYSLILGDPGAGKSTILDYLTTKYTVAPIKQAMRFGFTPALVPFRRKVSTPCPIYVPLRRCQAKNKTLLADVLDEETSILPEAVRQKMPKQFIEHCVEHGRAFLLLDGLDEVADEETYHFVVQKVNTFVQLYPKNKIVVTCRKAGWRGELNPDFQIYSALPLDSQQQYDFVHKWYAAILQYISHGISVQQNELQRRAEREANQLLTLLRAKERLSELASNPLMLSLICLVHKQRKDLPRGRTALYQDCLDILLELWDRVDKEFDQRYPTTQQKKQLLRCIAYRMHHSGAREVNRSTLEDFVLEFLPSVKGREAASGIVRQLEVRSGLIAERSINKLAFSHLTFQEFLVVDYINNEQNKVINLNVITDWLSWREPILLMCGTKNKTTSFIEELYRVQPLLALYCIAEADPTGLDMGVVQLIVNDLIDRVQKQEFEINEALPPLIDLLSVEGNPFGESIIKFIHARVHGYSEEEVSNLIEALSKVPTKESAKIILSLLTRFDLGTVEIILINGLARIGDAAIDGALEWRERDELSELQLFKILEACHMPFATKTFWLRYQLEPLEGYELVWAKSWGLRLADQKNDAVLRPLTVSHAGISDPHIWPYRQNDQCVIAAIVNKAFSILSDKYKTIDDLYNDIKVFKSFCLRLLVPMLVLINKHLYYQKIDELEKKKREIEEYLVPYSSIKEYFAPYISMDFFREHTWYTLGYFMKRKKKSTVWLRILLYMGITLGLGNVLLANAGIVTLLPPDGNVLHFWAWLPVWGRVVLPIGWLIWAYLCWYFYSKICIFTFTYTTIQDTLSACIVAIFPITWFYIFILDDYHKTFELTMGLKKIFWKSFLYTLVVSIITAIFEFLAIKHWFMSKASPYLYIPVFTTIVFLGIFLFEYATAFEYNFIDRWLQLHPGGNEVFDEFAM